MVQVDHSSNSTDLELATFDHGSQILRRKRFHILNPTKENEAYGLKRSGHLNELQRVLGSHKVRTRFLVSQLFSVVHKY